MHLAASGAGSADYKEGSFFCHHACLESPEHFSANASA
jgi:hypothetical protein